MDNYNVFKGIRQVFASTYTALTNSQKEGFLWFVRYDTATTVGDIYFGTKKYSEAISDEDITELINTSLSAHTSNTVSGGTSSQMHLPTVTASDNNKVLAVIDGIWTLAPSEMSYSGNDAPNNALGNDGDIYIQTE